MTLPNVFKLFTVTLVALTLPSVTSGQISNVVFSTPTTVTSDSDIISNGNFDFAINFGGSDVTVGSTFFEGFAPPLSATGFQSFASSAGVSTGGSGVSINSGGFFTPFVSVSDPGVFDATGTSVSTGFESVLDSFTESPDDLFFDVTNLPLNRTYSIQVFVSDDRDGSGSNFATVGAVDSDTYSFADSVSYVVTADVGPIPDPQPGNDAFVRIELRPDDGQTQVNAIVVRSVETVPEPSGVLPTAVLGFGLLLRRKR